MQVRGDEAFPFIPAADDLEEEVGGARVVGEVAKLVNDEEAALAILVEAAGETAGGLLAAQVEQELRSRGEQDVMPREDGLVGDVLGDHRLAQARDASHILHRLHDPSRSTIDGIRWSLAGAEAVLRLRALRASGDFDECWRFHEQQEYQRTHAARYADGHVVPVTGRALRRVK